MSDIKNNNLVGIAFMVGGMFLLILMDATAKWLVETNIAPAQILAIRSGIITFFILMFLFLRQHVVLMPNGICPVFIYSRKLHRYYNIYIKTGETRR
jgi:hypothetical protein